MPDTKTTGLTAVTALTADDVLYVVDDASGTPLSRKITAANAQAYLQGSPQAIGAQQWPVFALNAAIRGGPNPVGMAHALSVMTADRLTFSRVTFAQAATITKIAVRISTAGSAGNLVRLGLYDSNTDGTPKSLLADTGDMAVDVTGFIEGTVSAAVVPTKEYWLAAVFNTASPVATAAAYSSALANAGNVGYDSASVGATTYRGAIFRAYTFAALPATETGNTYSYSSITCPTVYWGI